MRGGIRFRVVGVEIPEGHVAYFNVDLYDPTIKNPVVWPTHGGSFPTQLDQTVWVPVADGKYRLAVSRGGFYGSAPKKPRRVVRELPAGFELDFSELPPEVEIAGNTIELTIRAHELVELKLQEPADDATIDLRSAVFRWASVPQAAHYNIGFGHREKIPGGVRTNFIYDSKVESTSFSLGTIPDADQEKLEKLVEGQTGTWSVSAYDASDRHIGSSAGDRIFQVGHGLDEK